MYENDIAVGLGRDPDPAVLGMTYYSVEQVADDSGYDGLVGLDRHAFRDVIHDRTSVPASRRSGRGYQ